MDLNRRISKSFDNRKHNHTRSTVFDATYEQANLSSLKSCPKQLALDINRNATTTRSSRTFASTVFSQAEKQLPRVNIHKPSDHSAAYFYGSEPTEYYKKNKISDFEPNFIPDYKYKPNWIVETDDFLPIPEDYNDINNTPVNVVFKSPRPEGIYPVNMMGCRKVEVNRQVLCTTPQPKIEKDIDKLLSPEKKNNFGPGNNVVYGKCTTPKPLKKNFSLYTRDGTPGENDSKNYVAKGENGSNGVYVNHMSIDISKAQGIKNIVGQKDGKVTKGSLNQQSHRIIENGRKINEDVLGNRIKDKSTGAANKNTKNPTSENKNKSPVIHRTTASEDNKSPINKKPTPVQKNPSPIYTHPKPLINKSLLVPMSKSQQSHTRSTASPLVKPKK
ncbi:hypothetical protein SteCoe_9408 [Stentor coeruleus]|uniref:Uncharacterized protein n=1 Tax=Stentor coeruleus TaxID=5963 RepID=A0A1R2CI48_9CILI|nr:hypothetical protein SteCoe_9408 [Stentor coeruleus]